MRKPKSWTSCHRHTGPDWTDQEDATLVEMAQLGVGLHPDMVAAVLPARTVGQAIERRYQLREQGRIDYSKRAAL